MIQAIVEVIRPKPGEVICDPACGTGGFLLATHGYLAGQYKLDKNQKKHLRYDALRGIELVEGVGRLCALNLFLSRADFDDFVRLYNPENRHERKPTWPEKKPEGRWRAFTYDLRASLEQIEDVLADLQARAVRLDGRRE